MCIINLLVGIILISLGVKFGVRIFRIISKMIDGWLDKLENKFC